MVSLIVRKSAGFFCLSQINFVIFNKRMSVVVVLKEKVYYGIEAKDLIDEKKAPKKCNYLERFCMCTVNYGL